MSNDKYSEFLTPDNAMLTMTDHQTGLMVGLGDEHPTVLKKSPCIDLLKPASK